MDFKIVVIAVLVSSISLSANDDIYNKSMEDILLLDSELKADIGSRDGARNYLDSNTPVDVITYKQIENSGLTSLTDVLRYFVAGFNAPETSVADGSDHVRTFTLRGMSPDQVLVLINGKRLHTSSLLHVNGVIGRGSANVDLDTIALSSIERVEILRDGAAAQYGSDAISGVINIILKGMGHGSRVSGQYGKRSEGDGEKIQAGAFVSIPLNYDGFVNITMEAVEQESTQRAGKDNRLTPPRVQTHVGVPESQSYKAMLNAEILQINSLNIYSNALVNYRDSEASAFYRPANTNSGDGFLPLINAKILDYAVTFGAKGEFDDSTTWDLSNSYGVNSFHYYVNDSMNYSLGVDSPTSFDNGSLNFLQNTTNLDLKKRMSNLKLAGGLEFRYENYNIEAGDSSSYYETGSQGFAGFASENEVDEDRYSYAVYVDSVYNLSRDFTVEVLARYEEYSDFGESTNAKLALSYKITPELMLRSSGSTGFRAPSLAQSNYSQTSSFIDSSTGLLSTQGTFTVEHELSKSLGAEDLKSERSKNFSAGGVYQPSKKLSLMLDYFYIEVNDRIMLTNDLSPTSQDQQLIFNKYNVSEARYFTNAAKTKTMGIDIKVDYQYILQNSSKLDFNFWFNYTDNKISDTAENVANSVETVRIEDGQPNNSLRLLTNYEIKSFNIALNISRFGEYSQMIDNKTYDFDAAITTDLDISYKLTKKSKIAIGGTNIFNVVPNEWDGLKGDFYGSNGIKRYSRYSPFGYSGAYYYIRASMEF